MQVVRTPQEIRDLRINTFEGKSVGLVPTMGFLHEGHLSLVKNSREENDITVVSIFVNPIQFGPREDLADYPRDMERDLMLLEQQGVDLVYAPQPGDMYEDDFSTFVEETSLSKGLCGASRPGHFRGVCTVVLKLFNIVAPDRAYFGLKDYQQYRVICRMARDLNVPVEIKGCPIVREPDGLALSSRNMYLSPRERESALLLSKSIVHARKMVRDGVRSCSQIRAKVLEILGSDPAVSVEYVSLKDACTLEDLQRLDSDGVLAIAARVGKARLIDNTLLEPGKE